MVEWLTPFVRAISVSVSPDLSHKPHGRHLVGFGGGFDALGPTDALGCCTCPWVAGTFGPDAPTAWPTPRNERPFMTGRFVGRVNSAGDWEAIRLTTPIQRNPAGCAGLPTTGSWTSSWPRTGLMMSGLSCERPIGRGMIRLRVIAPASNKLSGQYCVSAPPEFLGAIFLHQH